MIALVLCSLRAALRWPNTTSVNEISRSAQKITFNPSSRFRGVPALLVWPRATSRLYKAGPPMRLRAALPNVNGALGAKAVLS